MDYVKKWVSILLTAVLFLSILFPGMTFVQAASNNSIIDVENSISAPGEEFSTVKAQSLEMQSQAIDQEVARVIQLIQELPTIEEANEVTKLALTEARAAFDALTESQKLLVTNSNVLVEKENMYASLTEIAVSVNVRVEGFKGTHLNIKDFIVTSDSAISAAEATKQALEAHNIKFDYRDRTGYFASIAGESEKELGAGSGWMFKVNGVYPNVYSPDVKVQDGDEIVWDYINSFSVVQDLDMSIWGIDGIMRSGAESVDKITFNPEIEMQEKNIAGEDIQLSVKGTFSTVSYMYEKVSGPETIALDNVTVEFNNKRYVTDANGNVTIPGAEVIQGEHTLRFSKDLPGTIFTDNGDKHIDSYPRIIRTYKTIVVEDKPENLVRKKTEEAIEKGKQYVNNNVASVSSRVNGSHSGYWMLSAMYGIGMDISQYNWSPSPLSEDSFWSKGLDQKLTTANEELGTIIGAKLLGLDPTNIKSRNILEDLLARKNNGMYSTAWGEPWAMVALSLVETEEYDAAEHLKFPLNSQNKTTGLIGTNELTGWWLIALAPYKDQPEVQAAIDKAIAGLHTSFENNGFIDNSNTLAAIINGLGAVGEDLSTEKWTFQSGNLLEYFIDTYQLPDGSFKYKASQTSTNVISTEQSLLALADAYHKNSTFVRLNQDNPEQPDQPTDPGNPDDEPTNPTPPDTGTPTNPTKHTVSISITISANEVVLPTEQFEVQADETAFDLLRRITSEKQIALNARQTSMGMYVVGIAGVNEFDRGALSGWTYRVNGNLPEYSSDKYKLQAGDSIEWIYTNGEDNGSGGTLPGDQVNPPTEIIKEDQEGVEIPSEKVAEVKREGKSLKLELKHAKVVIPTEGLALAAAENLKVEVKIIDKQYHVILQAISDNGSTRGLPIGKEYIQITLSSENLTSNLVALRLTDEELKAVPHQIKNGEVILFVKSGGIITLQQSQVTFKDIEKLANKSDIEFLASRYVIKGKDANTFDPNSPITRAQFASMISRALGLEATGEQRFEDTKGKWYAADVQALFEAGITTGKTSSTFDPESHITRQQAAAFMARVLEYTKYEKPAVKEVTYKDADRIHADYKNSIALLQQLRIMTGKEDGTFDAGGHLTRAQMAKVLKLTLVTAELM